MRSARVWVTRVSSTLVGVFTRRKRSEPSGRSTYNPVEKQHVEVDIPVVRAAEALGLPAAQQAGQGDCTRLCHLKGKARLLDQVRGDETTLLEPHA